MAAILSNDWYISANQYDIGPSSGSSSSYQQHNATKVHDTFIRLGWTENAIAGMLGNMMYESCLDPACVYPKSSFPNGGASLNDISNQYAISRTSPAYGLVQWKGTTSTAPAGNQLVSYAIRHNSQWYEGQIQMDRLTWEYQNDQKFHPQTIDGVRWTFSVYARSTQTPEYLAVIFMRCYEGTYSVVPQRKANATNWYRYFVGSDPDPDPDPDPPAPPPEPPTPYPDWVTGETFANNALAYKDQYIPYSQMDCVQFVNQVWKDTHATTASDNLPMGTNTLWRSTKTYNTTAPNADRPPCPVLYYKDTIDGLMWTFDTIPTGTLLFHKISDEGPPPIPDQYADDGIGNFAHVGIYCGYGRVMQSGGRDSASVPGGGVHLSEFDWRAWNYGAFVVWVNCFDSIYPPPEPHPPGSFPYWLLFKFKGRGIILP